jgi:hypothetical protein
VVPNKALADALSERDGAFHWLEKSFEERSAYMTNLMHDPALDTLRPDPRFRDLVRRVGLTVSAKHTANV